MNGNMIKVYGETRTTEDTRAVVAQPNNLVKFVNLDFENLTFLANLYLLLHFSMKLEGILN